MATDINIKKYTASGLGLLFASLVIFTWIASIILLMRWHFSFSNPLLYVMILVQMHLYTGLFITAHDAMHGTVSPNQTVNKVVGQICTFFYAAFWYPKLYTKHHLHHSHVHTEHDPDYHNGSFSSWFLHFFRNYYSIWQVVFMAVLFNVFKNLDCAAEPDFILGFALADEHFTAFLLRYVFAAQRRA